MPSQSLEGLTTESGWTVTQALNNPLGSGGNFCVRYLARAENGEEGFLKAMDLTRASMTGNLREVQKTINEYVFEQDILERCKDRKMSKVVVPLDSGTITVPNFPPSSNIVYYIIFEKADSSLREAHFSGGDKSWLAAFIALHHTALGIEQLHTSGIAHQDIKPSNILRFQNDLFKVSDLGRVVDRIGSSPFSHLPFPGDGGYRPIEMYFGEWGSGFDGRKACDVFMVGSLLYNMIERVPINESIHNEAGKLDLQILQKPYLEALPFLMTAFNTILARFEERCEELFDKKVAKQLHDIIFEMCHPDYSKRALKNPSSKSTQFSMRRYSGKLATLVQLAKVHGVA